MYITNRILRPQRFVLIILTLLIMLHQFIPHASANPHVSGFMERTVCNSKTVKQRAFFNKAANAFLAIRNGNVTTVKLERYHFVYTITAGTSHEFFIYQLDERKFVCYMRGKRGKPGRFVARRIPNNANCLFNEMPSLVGGYTRLEVNNIALQFNKSGKQVPDRSAVMNARHHKQRADFAEFTSSARCKTDETEIALERKELCKTFKNLKKYPKDLQSLCKQTRKRRV